MWWTFLTALATSDGTPEECNGIDDDGNGLVDDGAFCTGCEQYGYEGASYLVCPDEVAGQAEAGAVCAALGYHLVDVESEAEHLFVSAQLDLLETYWTGLTDSNPDAYRWSDGANADYIPWQPTQPDDLDGSEGCAWYFAESGSQIHLFNDVSCTATGAATVCESEPSPFEPCDTGVVPDTGDTGAPDPVVGYPGYILCACQTGSPTGFAWFLPLWLLVRTRRKRTSSLVREAPVD